MRYFRFFIVTIVLATALNLDLSAQCAINIEAPAGVCKNELFEIQNNTTASSFAWDFCPGDLVETPLPLQRTTIGGNRIFDLIILQDQGKWYGFALGALSNSIIRIDFGTDLFTNVPQVTDLGNPGNLFDMPTSMDFAKQNDNWYAVVSNQNNTTLTLVSFGTSLESVPTSSLLLSSVGGNEASLDIVETGAASCVVVVANYSGLVTSISFPDGLANAYGEIASSAGYGNVVDIQGVLDCDGYHAFLLRIDSKTIVHLNFGDDLSAAPETIFYPSLQFSFTPYRFSIEKEGDRIYALVANITGGLATVDLGNIGDTESTVYDFGTLGVLQNSYNVFAVKHGDDWTAAMVNGSSREVYVLSFPNDPCDASIQSSSSINPGPVSYPDAGSYQPVLSATYDNGIEESISINITVSNPITASFDLPALDPLCTGQEMTFTNTSTFNDGDEMRWQWMVDSDEVSDSEHLDYIFTSATDHEITLIARNAGCESEVSVPITSLQEGPVVAFTSADHCFGSEASFKNNSSDNVESFNWDFGDGTASGDFEPTHKFSEPGVYEIKLLVTTGSGCNNFITEQLIVYTLPEADFSFGAPPDACNGVEMPFFDQSGGDYEIHFFTWNFRDPAAPEPVSVVNPLHLFEEAGTYNVSLTVEDTNGCIDSVEKEVVVHQTPSPEFSYTTACIGLPVTFDSNEAVDWEWQIGDKTYTKRDPVHTFRNPGEYQVSLNIISSSGCEAFSQDTIVVPVPLTPEFTFAKNCVSEATLFTDITEGEDPIAEWLWNIDDEGDLSGTAVELVFETEGDHSVTLQVTTGSGCVYEKSKTVPIVPFPIADFLMSSDIGAPPFPVNFTNHAEHASVFEWDFGDNATSTEQSPEHTYTETGEFSITLKASNAEGCVDNLSKTLTLTPAAPDVSIQAITKEENADGSVKVMIVLINNGNTILNDLPVDIDVSGSVHLKELIEGPVMPRSRMNLKLPYGLDSRGLQYLCAHAALEGDVNPESNKNCIDLDEEPVVFMPVYPNPVKEDLTIEWVSIDEQLVEATLYNSFGRVVWTDEFESVKGLNRKTVRLYETEKGIYMLVLKGQTINATQRILLAR